MVGIMQQVHVVSVLHPDRFKELGNMQQILLARPKVLRRQSFLRRLVEELAASYAIRALQSRNARLRAHGKISLLDVLANPIDSLADIAAVRVTIDHHTSATF